MAAAKNADAYGKDCGAGTGSVANRRQLLPIR
jgi:hypothetical protein